MRNFFYFILHLTRTDLLSVLKHFSFLRHTLFEIFSKITSYYRWFTEYVKIKVFETKRFCSNNLEKDLDTLENRENLVYTKSAIQGQCKIYYKAWPVGKKTVWKKMSLPRMKLLQEN